jgi:hypothetical protein
VSDLSGRSIGPYQIVRKIDRGGMAEVYLAFHTMPGAYRAIKIMPPLTATAGESG